MRIVAVGAASGGGLSVARLSDESLPEDRLPEDRLSEFELSDNELSESESSEVEDSSGVMRRRFRRGSLAFASGAAFGRLRVWEGEGSDRARGPGRFLYNDLVRYAAWWTVYIRLVGRAHIFCKENHLLRRNDTRASEYDSADNIDLELQRWETETIGLGVGAAKTW